MVEEQVHRGAGDEDVELLEELDGIEEVGGAIAPYGLEVRRGRARRGEGGGGPGRAAGGGDSGRPLPKRWITVTVPVWPSEIPRARAVRA